MAFSTLFARPPYLTPGDQVMVVSSSGALRERVEWEKGIALWQERGYQVHLGNHWDSQWGYLAGSDAERRQDLAQAWGDRQIKAILCSRGGYGSARLLEHWQWPSLPEPKWVIGFSDVTGLLWSLASQRIVSVHGPVLTTLAAEPAWSQERLFNFLEAGVLPPWQGLGWGGGRVRGPLIAGNLTVATHFLQTPYLPQLAGAILAIEDVTEAPYRIDRLLTQWRLTGVLATLGGIALGRFSRCLAPAGLPSWTVAEVLRDRLGDLGLPVVSDLPFGHDGANGVLPLGLEVELDGDGGTLTFCE